MIESKVVGSMLSMDLELERIVPCLSLMLTRTLPTMRSNGTATFDAQSTRHASAKNAIPEIPNRTLPRARAALPCLDYQNYAALALPWCAPLFSVSHAPHNIFPRVANSLHSPTAPPR